MRLPNADHATIDLAKLRDYCLNPRHPRGRHKARVFRAALGYTARDAEALRDAILAAVPTVEARSESVDEFGRRFVADCPVAGPRGSGVVRTAWIVPRGEDAPHLTTCFVL
jgi:hypothetical protein